jgi:hypothetical protein
MGQTIQVLGALLILAAYVLAQFRVIEQNSRAYLWPNLVGATVLAADAWFERQWGFFLLEGVWALVSVWSLIQSLRRGASPPAA